MLLLSNLLLGGLNCVAYRQLLTLYQYSPLGLCGNVKPTYVYLDNALQNYLDNDNSMVVSGNLLLSRL